MLTLGRVALADGQTQSVTIGPDCPLPYSPFAHETAAPLATYLDFDNPGDYSFVCSLDQDHDGFDDHIEAVLADCFAPVLRFDSAENAVVHGVDLPGGQEPVPLYSVDPPKAGGLRATLRWTLLYSTDGGFHSWLNTQDDHLGDTASIGMSVVFNEVKGSWYAHLGGVHADVRWDEGGTASSDVQTFCADTYWATNPFVSERECFFEPVKHLEVVGTHPVVYPSAGKHHMYLHPQGEYLFSDARLHTFVGPDVPFFEHYDRANGAAPPFPIQTTTGPSGTGRTLNIGRVFSGSLPQLPAEYTEDSCAEENNLETLYGFVCGCTGQDCPPQASPADCGGLTNQISTQAVTCNSWNGSAEPAVNECLRDRLNVTVPANFFSDLDLHAWWPKANLTSGKRFCGDVAEGCDTETDPILKSIVYSGPFPVDTDGDGRPNWADKCPLVNHDDAPLDPSKDVDGDGAAWPCDPDDKHWDRWVGPGSSALNLRAKVGTAFGPDAGEAGWLDTDGDGYINSKDACPFTWGWAKANTNSDGEQLAFPTSSYNQTHNGYLQRANWCDPFETTFVKAKIPIEGTFTLTGCYYQDKEYTAYVPDTVYVEYASVFGLSANDPALSSAPTYKQRAQIVDSRTKSVPVTLERCACNLDDAATCQIDVTSTCFVPLGLNGSPPNSQNAEFGWRALGEPGCTPDPEGYCLPILDTAKPAIPNACDPITGKCDQPPAANLEATKYLAFSWSQEAADPKHPGHWPDSLFTTTAAGYKITQHPVLFGSEVARNPDPVTQHDFLYSRTASAPYLNPVVVGQEPDVDASRDPITGAHFDDAGWLLQTRRLRSFTSTVGGHLTEGHDVTFLPVLSNCTAPPKAPPDPTAELVNIVLPPEPSGLAFSRVSPETLLTTPRGWALVQSAAQAITPFAGLMSLATGKWLPISLAGPQGFSPAAAATLSNLPLSGNLSTILGTSNARLTALATQSDPLDPLPQLLLVVFDATDVSGGTWFRLTPAGIDAAGAEYAVAGAGVLPAGARVGALRADTISGAAVLFDEVSADEPPRVWRFENGRWAETPRTDIPLRTRAAYAVHDGVAFRAGGADSDGVIRADVMAIDTRDGRNYAVASALPGRLSPALAWDSEDRGLVYGGGVDAAGAPHTDLLWVGVENAPAVPLTPDLAVAGGPRVNSDSLVIASGQDPRALVLATSTAGGLALLADAWLGSRSGWQPTSVLSLGGQVATCPDGTSARLCAASSQWWSDPGHVTCGGTACEPTSARPLQALNTLAYKDVEAIDVDDLSVWVGIGTKVERWSFDDPPTRLAVFNFGSPVRDVRVGGGAIGVSTKIGFSVIARHGGSFAVSAPLGLCGSPLAAEPLTGGRWVVATSAGITLVASDGSGSPAIEQSARLALDDGTWSAVPVAAAQAPADKACKALDLLICAGRRCDAGRERAPFSLVGDRVVLAPPRGPKPFETAALKKPDKNSSDDEDDDDTAKAWLLLLSHDADGWHVGDELATFGRLKGLRASGDFVYGVTHADAPWQGHSTTPAFRVANGEIIADGSHDVPWWVERRETLDHRARLSHGSVDLAAMGP